jgi:hypothetical protein
VGCTAGVDAGPILGKDVGLTGISFGRVPGGNGESEIPCVGEKSGAEATPCPSQHLVQRRLRR